MLLLHPTMKNGIRKLKVVPACKRQPGFRVEKLSSKVLTDVIIEMEGTCITTAIGVILNLDVIFERRSTRQR